VLVFHCGGENDRQAKKRERNLLEMKRRKGKPRRREITFRASNGYQAGVLIQDGYEKEGP